MIATTPSSALLAFDARAFGRRLVELGEIGEVDWRLAEEVARQNGHTPLRAILDLGLLGEDVIADRLAAFTGLARWRAEGEEREIDGALPRAFLGANAALLLSRPETGEEEGGSERERTLVISDPSDRRLWQSTLMQLRSGRLAVAIGVQKEIERFLAQREQDAVQAVREGGDALDVSAEISQLRDMASEAPVVRFFNQTVERAMDLGASDIHLERFDHRSSLRLRVDGVLVEQPPPQTRMYDALLCRIKIMAGLDIAERRLAQDGRIRMRLRGRMVDLRVSLVPTLYGQDAAIRLQDRKKLGEVGLPDLGFSKAQIEQLLTAANKSHGIVLVTGPTGSGKTTTLYALLRALVTSELKVVTVEDPVEYAMDGVNQIQVNPAIGLSFGNTLRHVLRHDPDVILIGEIRDAETAEMAFQSALTGHMVLSTLHTNDVPGTFVRLIDMGVEPYLVNAAVEGVSAQRLVRRLCTDCRNREGEREGCRRCGGIGYRGRVALMEFAPLNAGAKRAVLEGGDERRIREALVASGYVPMRESATRLVGEGVTDEAEVARALGVGGAEALP
jgi:general secretion pathway protein E